MSLGKTKYAASESFIGVRQLWAMTKYEESGNLMLGAPTSVSSSLWDAHILVI